MTRDVFRATSKRPDSSESEGAGGSSPAPGKRTPTSRLPRHGARAKRATEDDAEPAGNEGALQPHDDPFGLHLPPPGDFVGQLDLEQFAVTPWPLRLERGRAGTMHVLPMSMAPLPEDARPVPLWCKLQARDGTSVDENGGTWLPNFVTGPSLPFTVPGPGRYRLEVHVNAGHPGARVLSRYIHVRQADEETVASDQSERLAAAASNFRADEDASPPPVATYRDMLSAVLAAEQFTRAGDEVSYARAIGMLEPVLDRLHEIYPQLLDQRAERRFSKNAIDLRFGGARDGMRSWLGKLYLAASINPTPWVDAFRAGSTEIKMGTGEQFDASDLEALDGSAVTTAKVVAVGAAAIVVAPLALEALAAIGAEAGALQVGARLYTWAVANPQSALLMSEILVGMGLGIADQGPDQYFHQIQDNEDLAWAVYQTLQDLAEARAGMGGGPDVAPPRGGTSGRAGPRTTAADEDIENPRAPAPNPRGKKGNKPPLETDSTSLDGRDFHNDIRNMSSDARHVVRQLENRGWVRVDAVHPDDLVAISKWFGREIGVLQSPYASSLRVVLGTRDGILARQLKPGEVFVVHTHPVMTSKASHFDLDLPNAGKHIEAVVDWSGQITYYDKTGIKNPVRPDGTIAPLSGYEAAFLNEDGAIAGFAKIDIVDGPNGTTVKVRE